MIVKDGPQKILNVLKQHGVSLYVWLPDEWIKFLSYAVQKDPEVSVVQVAREEEGIGILSGFYFGGKRGVLAMANSGMLTCSLPIVTLSMLHQIPVVMLISLRGHLGEDAALQAQTGRVTIPFLHGLGVVTHLIENEADIDKIGQAIDFAWLTKQPVALLLAGDLFEQKR